MNKKILKYTFSLKHIKQKTIFCLGILLFIFLTAGPVLLYNYQNINWYVALMISQIIANIIFSLIIYIIVKKNLTKVVFFTLSFSSLLFIFNPVQTKHSVSQKEKQHLHSSLKRAVRVANIIGLNPLITDISRDKSFYKKYNLKEVQECSHYLYNGVSYAIDIRTKNNNFIKNFLLNGYFNVMGFHSDRHGGTADHIHVEVNRKRRFRENKHTVPHTKGFHR